MKSHVGHLSTRKAIDWHVQRSNTMTKSKENDSWVRLFSCHEETVLKGPHYFQRVYCAGGTPVILRVPRASPLLFTISLVRTLLSRPLRRTMKFYTNRLWYHLTISKFWQRLTVPFVNCHVGVEVEAVKGRNGGKSIANNKKLVRKNKIK